MIDFLYSVLISPLEYLMRIVFEWGADKFGSYGISIVAMSLIVNTAILPIYNRAEGWQEEERQLRKLMKQKEDMIKRSSKGQERFAYIATLYRQYGYSHMMKLKASVGFLLQIPFFFSAYHLLSNAPELNGKSFLMLVDLGKADALISFFGFHINAMPLLMTIVNILSASVYSKNLSKKDKTQLYGMSGVFLILLYSSPAALTLYWTLNNVYSLGKNIVEKSIIPAVRDNWTCRGSRILHLLKATNNIGHGASSLFWPSISLFCLITLAYFPLRFYLSDPLAFPEGFWTIVKGQLFVVEVLVILLGLVWIAVPDFARNVLGFVCACFVISCVVYGFIVVPDYGGMDDSFRLAHAELLNKKSYRYVDYIILLCIFIAVLCVVSWEKVHILKKSIIACIFGMSCVTIFFSLVASRATEEVNLLPDENKGNISIVPKQVKDMFVFSNKGTNIVVVMLDMFTGGNIKEIISRNPDILNKLDGFVWYQDVVTAGSSTVFGKMPILGGKRSHPLEINEIPGISIEEKHNKYWGEFLSVLQARDFDVSIHEHEFVKPGILKKYLAKPANLVNRYLLWNGVVDYWKLHSKSYARKARIESSRKFLTMVGFFKVIPRFRKKIIYKNGKWRNSVNMNAKAYFGTLNKWANLDSFRYLSSVSGSGRNQFKFFVNELTHVSWGMDETCQPCNEHTGSEGKYRSPETGLFEAHYRTELCSLRSLIKWFDWMRDKHVYDNTQIIIVSDHGRWDSTELSGMWSGTGRFNPKSNYPVALHGLMLVKDLNQHGLMKTDRTALMANWDVPEIIKQGLGMVSDNSWMDSNRERYHVTGAWQRGRHPKDHYNLSSVWKVKGTIYKKENWKRVK